MDADLFAAIQVLSGIEEMITGLFLYNRKNFPQGDIVTRHRYFLFSLVKAIGIGTGQAAGKQ
jgi:hypothetical protein